MAEMRLRLADMTGEEVSFQLVSGKNVTGKVTEVGDNFVSVDDQGDVLYIPFQSIIHFGKPREVRGGIH
jgi:hypothetical protein